MKRTWACLCKDKVNTLRDLLKVYTAQNLPPDETALNQNCFLKRHGWEQKHQAGTEENRVLFRRRCDETKFDACKR